MILQDFDKFSSATVERIKREVINPKDKGQYFVVIGKVDSMSKLGKFVILDGLKFKIKSYRVLNKLKVNISYSFIIDKKFRIISDDISHVFCPYLIE